MMGRATEELAARSGPGIGGLLNVTFGNAPEIIIALFALNEGLQEVVKASIVGSILGQHAARPRRRDVRRGAGPRASALRPHGGHGAVGHAAAGRHRDGHAGDLRDGGGPGSAGPRRRDRQLRLQGRGPLLRRRHRPAPHLRGRPAVLAADPPRPLQPPVGPGPRGTLECSALGAVAGGRRGGRGGHVRDPRGLDLRDGGGRSASASSSSGSSSSPSSATPPSTGSRCSSPARTRWTSR